MAYINREDGDLVCFLSAFAAYLEGELEDKPRSKLQGYKRRVHCMMTYCKSMIDDILYDLEPQQRNMLAKKCGNQRLMLTFKEDVRLKKEMSIVPTWALSKMINSEQAFSPCLGCELTGKEAKENCEWHDILIALGATGYPSNKKTECPFKRGL